MSDELLSDDELLRYHRQINLAGVDIDGQERLKQARVLVIGVGGLGCAAAQYLALAGVGQLTLVDHDVVESSNLQRQVLHRESRIGDSKVCSAAAALAELNPLITVTPVAAKADEALLAQLLPQHDLLLDCSDNLACRQLLNRMAGRWRVPLVSAAAIRLEGQLALFRWQADEPCYQCFSHHFSEPGASCVEAGVLAPIVGVLGSLQALEALKLLLHLGEWPLGQLLLIDGLTGRFQPLRLQPWADCPVCAEVKAAMECTNSAGTSTNSAGTSTFLAKN